MKTGMVWIAGAMFASMMLTAASGPSAEERARVKYGRTAEVKAQTASGAKELPRAEQWNRAKFGRIGVTAGTPATHCPFCEVGAGPAVSVSDARAHVKYGRPLPVEPARPACDHACCQQDQ